MDILSQITKLLEQHCQTATEKIHLEARLQEDLGLDSVKLLTLAAEVENHWEIYLEESPENPPYTIGELVELIEQRLEEKN